MRIVFSRIAGFLIACTLLACQEQSKDVSLQEEGIMVTDVSGASVWLKAPAQRVVCLFDPALDAIFMLQKEDKLVGMLNNVYQDMQLYPYYAAMDDRIARKTLPTPGSNKEANMESIIALNPDLVIIQGSQDGSVAMLREIGIPVYCVSGEQSKEVFKEMEDIATLLGAAERGAELLKFTNAGFDKLAQQSEVLPQQKSAYFAWAYGRIFSTTGTNSIMHTCLLRAGVLNVCQTPLDQANINAETLIAWDPELIFIWNDSPELFYSRKELAGIRAVKNREITNLMPMFFYNPHTLKSLATATRIHYSAYPQTQVQVKDEIQQLMRAFYGTDKAAKLLPLLLEQ